MFGRPSTRLDRLWLAGSLVGALAAITAVVFAGSVFANHEPGHTTGPPVTPGPPDQVTICHRTSAEVNPFVFIEISEAALDTHLAHGDFLADSAAECAAANQPPDNGAPPGPPGNGAPPGPPGNGLPPVNGDDPLQPTPTPGPRDDETPTEDNGGQRGNGGGGGDGDDGQGVAGIRATGDAPAGQQLAAAEGQPTGLARTGSEPWLYFVLGVPLILAGILLRRQLRVSQRH